jgi:uncharacterized membrane protein
MPLWMAAFAALAGERPQAREWLGIALGLAGVGLLVGGAELSATPTATAILCGSPLAWALGSLLARRWSVGAGLHAAAAPMLTGGVCLLIAALARGETWPAAPSARSLAAWVYLLVLGSLVAFSAYAWLLKHARPAVATSYAFVNPVLAVLLGVVLAGEPLTAATAIAAPLVIAAVVLVTARPRPRPTAPAASGGGHARRGVSALSRGLPAAPADQLVDLGLHPPLDPIAERARRQALEAPRPPRPRGRPVGSRRRCRAHRRSRRPPGSAASPSGTAAAPPRAGPRPARTVRRR